ncbi:hypothetical protein M422DRAFT_255080 [Sphaerobolus stellatus SS14]|uniref:Uncharacterized protein n=1 Tax=Sphaerobolus stellatus (strain SS14) TaxID=990650 RepID=A0A0C9V4E9_SPHS4|nr:hypothetical protein M422DRAFT_255080 [Sphaerobolus stellatus SS14]
MKWTWGCILALLTPYFWVRQRNPTTPERIHSEGYAADKEHQSNIMTPHTEWREHTSRQLAMNPPHFPIIASGSGGGDDPFILNQPQPPPPESSAEALSCIHNQVANIRQQAPPV